MKKPDFFIVGAPKCGTTAMYNYLNQHPEIFMPKKKEPHFFGSDLYSPWYIRDINAYLSLFKDVKNKKRIGEASVWYLYSKSAAYEIKEFNPDAQIIIMLRNPVDMMYSLHAQRVYNGNEDILDFEEALNAEEDRKKGLRMPPHPGLTCAMFYRDAARFTEQVKRYLDVFGRNKVHIIIYDDFKNNTAIVYKETLHFLGVDEDFTPDFKVINPNKVVRSRFLRDFLQMPPDFARLLVKIFIPCRGNRQKIIERLKRWNTIYKPRSPMNPELRKRLILEFETEIRELGKLIGRDLRMWYNPDE